MIQRDNRSDLVFQKLVDQLIIILDSSFIDMVGWKQQSCVTDTTSIRRICDRWLLTLYAGGNDPGPGDGENVVVQHQLLHQRNIILHENKK